MTTTNRIADTILSQLGGYRASKMMGASNVVSFENGVQFSIGRNAKKITKIRIELDPSDTYIVRFFSGSVEKVRFDAKTGEMKKMGGFKEVATISDVYADSLPGVVESNTGLYLSL